MIGPTRVYKNAAALLLTAAIPVSTGSAFAQGDPLFATPPLTRDTYGEVGLLDMPSARMASDGYLGLSISRVGGEQRYALWFQALPWLETSFRYSRVFQSYYDRSFGMKARLLKENEVLPEVSLGFRNILGTGAYSAEYLVASKQIGDFDLTTGLGWGRLADNNVFPNPFGIAVQSFKTRPIARVTSQFSGVADFGQFFHGQNVGVFGGVSWQTPVDGLRVIAEYSSDHYKLEMASTSPGFRLRSNTNIGLSYTASSNLSVSAGWFYGSTYGLAISLGGDASSTFSSPLRIGPAVPSPAIRTDDGRQSALKQLSLQVNSARSALHNGKWVDVPTAAQHARQELLQSLMSEAPGVRDVYLQSAAVIVNARFGPDPVKQCQSYARIAGGTSSEIKTFVLADLENPNGAVTFCDAKGLQTSQLRLRTWTGSTIDRAHQDKIANDIRSQDIVFSGLWAQGSEIWVTFENYRYRNTTEAAGRIARVLMADAPPSVEIFHLVPSILGVPQQEITISRSGLERALESYAPPAALRDTIDVSAPPMQNPGLDAWTSELYPKLSYAVSPRLTQHLFDPEHPIQFLVYADVPVLLQLMPGLGLEARATAKIWSDYTYSRPADSELPHVRSDVLKYLNYGKYGISSLNVVYTGKLAPEIYTQVRAGYLEDMFFGAGGQILWRPEQSRFTFGADVYQVWQRGFHRLFSLQNYNVVTGHVSMYYRSSWHGLNYAVHVGRYLAGDYGGTFEITRRFDSGVEIGAWATFTNVPFKKFGEGSFDKGIIIHIPFEWGLPIWSQSSYDLRLNSLTRDGGQRLGGDDSLYALTNGTSYGEITDHLGDIVEP